MWRSRAALLIAASWMAVLVISGVVSARLFALSPKGMVDHADAIVVAEVIAKEQTPGDTGVAPIVEYKLRVERVLKGQLSGNELAITVTPLLWSSVAPAEMLPDPGTKVFLLLRQDGGWRLAADLNAVAIIRHNQIVSLHQGRGVGTDGETWEPGDYVAVYQRYYEEHIAQQESHESPHPGTPAAEPQGWWVRFVDWLRSLLARLLG